MPVLCYKLISFYSFKIIPFVIKFRLLSVLISDFKNTNTEHILNQVEIEEIKKNNFDLYNFNEKVDFNSFHIIKHFIYSIDENYLNQVEFNKKQKCLLLNKIIHFNCAF